MVKNARNLGVASQRWMFLRGLGRHSLHWGSFPDRFQQAIPAAEIELLDLARQWHRGGPQQPSEHPRLRPGSAAKVAICCRGENTLQGEIARMVLINTSSRADSRFHQRLRWRNYLRILQIAMRKDELLVRERAILEMTARGFPRLESLAQDYAAIDSVGICQFYAADFRVVAIFLPSSPKLPRPIPGIGR